MKTINQAYFLEPDPQRVERGLIFAGIAHMLFIAVCEYMMAREVG